MLNVVMSFHGDAADFAAVALLLTAVGIYGVMAYLVALHFFTVSMTSSGGMHHSGLLWPKYDSIHVL